MEFRVTIDGQEHHIERTTLGDTLLLKKHFGIDSLSYVTDHFDDPAVVAGLVYLAMKRTHPEWEHPRLMNEVEDIAVDDLRFPKDEAPEGDESPKGDGSGDTA